MADDRCGLLCLDLEKAERLRAERLDERSASLPNGGLDPAVGLLIAALAVREGLEAWRSEGCCVAAPLPARAGEPRLCDDDCCA